MLDLKFRKSKFATRQPSTSKIYVFPFLLLTSIKYIYVLLFLNQILGPTFSTAYNHTFLRPTSTFNYFVVIFLNILYIGYIYIIHIYSYYSLIRIKWLLRKKIPVLTLENGGCYFVDNRYGWSKWVWISFNC